MNDNSNSNSGTTTAQAQVKPEIRHLAERFNADAFIYAASLRSKGHGVLADCLINNAMDLDYETHFAKRAFTTADFVMHLKNAYYSCTKAIECLRLVYILSLACDEHEQLVEQADSMQRMLHASVITMLRRLSSEGDASDSAFSNNPNGIYRKFIPPENTEYAEPRIRDKAAEDEGLRQELEEVLTENEQEGEEA